LGRRTRVAREYLKKWCNVVRSQYHDRSRSGAHAMSTSTLTRNTCSKQNICGDAAFDIASNTTNSNSTTSSASASQQQQQTSSSGRGGSSERKWISGLDKTRSRLCNMGGLPAPGRLSTSSNQHHYRHYMYNPSPGSGACSGALFSRCLNVEQRTQPACIFEQPLCSDISKIEFFNRRCAWKLSAGDLLKFPLGWSCPSNCVACSSPTPFLRMGIGPWPR